VIVNTPDGKRELGELFVAKGLARVYKNDFIPDAKEKEILVKLEAKAQQDKKGIWQSQQNNTTANKSSDSKKTPTSEQSKKLNTWLKQNGFANINAKGKYGYSPLHTAARQHNTEIVKLLLDAGAAVDAKDVNEWTPLHRISRDGGKDIAELLIAKGADVNAATDHGKTPLRLAEDANNSDIVNLLRQHGGKK
jgi:ankyrin repeat protein